MTKTLLELHEDVSADHYDLAIKKNIFQRFWHWRRFTEVEKFITPVSGNVLDIGCHSGLFTNLVKNKTGATRIFGIDISGKAIEKAKQRIPDGHFQVADGQKLPFKSSFFDAVFCLEVIEHVDYPQEVVSEIKRVLKEEGYGIMLVPTDNLLFRLIWFLWTLRYSVWRHAHVQSFTNNKLENLIRKSGLTVVKIKYFNLKMLKLLKFKK